MPTAPVAPDNVGHLGVVPICGVVPATRYIGGADHSRQAVPDQRPRDPFPPEFPK